jgi:hypothetical protein
MERRTSHGGANKLDGGALPNSGCDEGATSERLQLAAAAPAAPVVLALLAAPVDVHPAQTTSALYDSPTFEAPRTRRNAKRSIGVHAPKPSPKRRRTVHTDLPSILPSDIIRDVVRRRVLMARQNNNARRIHQAFRAMRTLHRGVCLEIWDEFDTAPGSMAQVNITRMVEDDEEEGLPPRDFMVHFNRHARRWLYLFGDYQWSPYGELLNTTTRSVAILKCETPAPHYSVGPLRSAEEQMRLAKNELYTPVFRNGRYTRP